MNQPALSHPQSTPRVVSLSPATTDWLCECGAGGLLVGRSAGCDHPGSTGVPVLPRAPQGRVFAADLAALRVDTVLAGPEVDSAWLAEVEAGAGPAARIVRIAPETVEAVWDSALTIGGAVGREEDARRLVVRLRERFFNANEFVNPYDDGPITVFLESADPPVCSGGWTAQLVERAGAVHALNPTTPRPTAGAGAGPQFAERIAGRSVRVPEEVLAGLSPRRLILCPREGGLDAARAMAASLARRGWWPSLRAVREGHVSLVDGTRTFHRAGPGIVDAYEWLVGWLNGVDRVIPGGFAWERFG